MAKTIGIYNNKGGVGKTTLLVFFADFLSSITINHKKSRVLILDFDPQSSCSNAILGIEYVAMLRSNSLTLPHLMNEKLEKGKDIDLSRYIHTRKEDITVETRKTKLGHIDIIVAEPDATFRFEEKATLDDVSKISEWLKASLVEKYDFILIDLPSNISKQNSFSLTGAFLADFFLIPIEPNRININALPLTLKILKQIKVWRGEGNEYELLGFILNKADKRTKQYKLHKDELLQIANIESVKIYKNILPSTPKLSNATDDSIECVTLSERYESYYANVRSVVLEVVKDLGFKY